MFNGKLEKISDFKWRIPESYSPGMRVPGIIFSTEEMLESILRDNAPEQVANAAHLPGIVTAAMAMPDVHWGYGLPIGGVVATDVEEGGVITPGGVGYDINCGVRLLCTDLDEEEVASSSSELVNVLFGTVPAGVGSTGDIKASRRETKKILKEGAGWAVKNGFGWESDLEFSEESGAMAGALTEAVSERSYKRGASQSGTLGSGNHFLEVQKVSQVFDAEAADVLGIRKGQVTVMIHTGSRGFGHQICSEFASSMIRAMSKYDIRVPDKQLACVPVKSPEGQAYLGAMRAAANYAWCNRQIITHLVRRSFERVFGESARSMGMRLVYDVAHNIAKIEKHIVNGRERVLCVHRKGATRALPAGHADVPERYRSIGQPVIIPGDMGTCSYLLLGTEASSESFYSTCHGAGRLLSRSAAKRSTRGRHIHEELLDQGILVRYTGRSTLHEEVPEAYKDVSQVVDIIEGTGISKKVAKMRPLAVIKG